MVKKMNNKKPNYKIITVSHNGENLEYEVVGLSDVFAWGKGKSVKGAVIGAMIGGIRLKDIDFNNHWVPVHECIQVVK